MTGLRERKKLAMRQQLSDTAARMFLERGFDAVRVAEVAAECGVSEKTVFNYFPTKEALVLDRLEATVDALRTLLGDPARSPVAAMMTVLERELQELASSLVGDVDPDGAVARYRRFGDMIGSTPALRTYQAATADRFGDVAAEVIAVRSGLDPDDPEPQIVAAALLGLWKVQVRSLRRHLHPDRPVPAATAAVTREVRRAASLIEDGLATFPATPAELTGQDPDGTPARLDPPVVLVEDVVHLPGRRGDGPT